MISLCIIVEICDWLVGSVCFSLMFAHHLFFFSCLGGIDMYWNQSHARKHIGILLKNKL